MNALANVISFHVRAVSFAKVRMEHTEQGPVELVW